MTKHNLFTEISRIHNKFSVLTPQVENVAKTIGSTLSIRDKTGSLHIILGDAGSGCSTAIEMSRRRVRRKLRNIVTLRSLALNEESNPWRLLLDYYGIHYEDADLKVKMNSIPRPIIDLIEHAEIDCIIVEDFLEGLNKPAERQQAVGAWLSLARHPIRVAVIVSTNNRALAKRLADEEPAIIHRIHEWNENDKFSLFIDKLQTVLWDDFNIRVDLVGSKNLLYKFCNGNTGNLINLIREYAVAELLALSNANLGTTEYLPLMSIIKKNAILLAAQSSQ